MSTHTIPVGSAVPGPILNANGEPVDQKGSLADAMHLPDVQHTCTETSSMRVLETGIKVLDLIAHHQSVLVVAGMSETTYDASMLREMLREMLRDIEAEDRATMLFEQTCDDISLRQRLLRSAMTIAAYFDGAGYTVLLTIDRHLAIPEIMADVHLFASANGILCLLLVPIDDLGQLASSGVLNDLDVEWWFNRARAQQGLWPAIDPLASCSRVLESTAVSQEHRQVAGRVREVLQRYYELRERAGSEILSEGDRRLLARAERIDLFLTQPFVVAEAYTDLPGVYLTVEETISSFRDILDGRYTALSAQAFNFVGRIEQG
jgi:F0F1-type ATP synthase beta subunit